MFNALWTEAQQARAVEDGWMLAITVDAGRPITTAYLELFQAGPRFNHRELAVLHVTQQAQARSKFHIEALSARAASRVPREPARKRK